MQDTLRRYSQRTVGAAARARAPGAFRRWSREPLLHFLVLGATLFALHHWVAPARPSNQIVLSESLIRGLRQDYARRNGAPPTAKEEAAMIQQFVDNEVLYREAIALGLDRGDVIVRRRLIQKMEFLSEETEPLPEPTDAQLQAYLDAHAERYATPARVTLVHVFASTDEHGNAARDLAARWRAQLIDGADAAALGDPFLRGREFGMHSERQLAGIFGSEFAARVMSLPAGTWSEPLQSSYGFHVVRVYEKSPAHHPQLTEVRVAVRRDWQEQHRTDATRAALDRLRQRYQVRIAQPESRGLSKPVQAAESLPRASVGGRAGAKAP